MATNVVPIKVVIGLKPNGHALYPDWNQLPLAQTERPEDHQVVKWVYDKTSGHQESTVDSPKGQQFGMMLVTQKFATEALATFPGTVTVMNEAEAQDFWENKAHAHIPANRVDTDHLLGLKAQRDLMVDLGQSTTAIDAQISDALNPDSLEPGVRKNKTKTWADAKSNLDIAVAIALPT